MNGASFFWLDGRKAEEGQREGGTAAPVSLFLYFSLFVWGIYRTSTRVSASSLVMVTFLERVKRGKKRGGGGDRAEKRGKE